MASFQTSWTYPTQKEPHVLVSRIPDLINVRPNRYSKISDVLKFDVPNLLTGGEWAPSMASTDLHYSHPIWHCEILRCSDVQCKPDLAKDYILSPDLWLWCMNITCDGKQRLVLNDIKFWVRTFFFQEDSSLYREEIWHIAYSAEKATMSVEE